ncbi:MAG: methyltransferase [Bacteroidetes bacterium]|nr:methyltransferase [Bacteroidota bacterium]MCL2303220.1 methyltransferase [Lentimicrobiaceae bacterium]
MFHFKKFSVNHSQSTMKVGTDAVMLGSWMPVPENCNTILEIGSGCGVISLMLAQITNAKITGIDIDEKSVEEAQKNLENFYRKDQVQFIWESVQSFAQRSTQKFEVIVSNPPFFQNSLKSPVASRNISRHNDNLSFEELIAAVDILLSNNGRFGVILPVEPAEKLEKLALEKCLYVTKKTYLYPLPDKKTNRILMMFERRKTVCEKDNLIIRNKGYTHEYYMFVKEFLKIECIMK